MIVLTEIMIGLGLYVSDHFAILFFCNCRYCMYLHNIIALQLGPLYVVILHRFYVLKYYFNFSK